MVYDFAMLSSEIEKECHLGYVDESILEIFQAVGLADISKDKWYHKFLAEMPEAAVHKAGYQPVSATLDAELFGHDVYTVDEEIRLNEKDWAFCLANGISEAGVTELGQRVGKGASKYLMTGQDAAGNAVEANTNFLLDEGASNGTKTRPLTYSTATAGAWSTWANQNTDMTKLISYHESYNYAIRNSVIFYPKIASFSMKRGAEGTRGLSAIEYALSQGVRACVALPNSYMYTEANATPAAAAFDLAIVDLSKIKIGYTRKPRFQTIGPHDSVRDTVVQGEVWFVPFFMPQNIDVAGTTKVFKGVTKITAINGA